MTGQGRQARERLRLEAAQWFARGDQNAVIAKEFRVSLRSVQRWRKDWQRGGDKALASKGPASLPLLSDAQFAVLERELAKGATAHGWPDQTWTLPRIKTLIGRRFHLPYTIQGVSLLLHRHGWSRQVPARRAVERDPATVAVWVKDTWPQVKRVRRRRVDGLSSKTKPGSR